MNEGEKNKENLNTNLFIHPRLENQATKKKKKKKKKESKDKV